MFLTLRNGFGDPVCYWYVSCQAHNALIPMLSLLMFNCVYLQVARLYALLLAACWGIDCAALHTVQHCKCVMYVADQFCVFYWRARCILRNCCWPCLSFCADVDCWSCVLDVPAMPIFAGPATKSMCPFHTLALPVGLLQSEVETSLLAFGHERKRSKYITHQHTMGPVNQKAWMLQASTLSFRQDGDHHHLKWCMSLCMKWFCVQYSPTSSMALSTSWAAKGNTRFRVV